MAIPSQLPQLIAAAKSGALQALALQAGQVVEGKVLGAGSNGATRVEIRGQLLNLLMPTPMKAGETVRFEIQGSGAQIKLALLPNASQPQTTAPAPPVPAARTSNAGAPGTAGQTAGQPVAPSGAGQVTTQSAQSAVLAPTQLGGPAATSTSAPQGQLASNVQAGAAPYAPPVQTAARTTVLSPVAQHGAAAMASTPPMASTPQAALAQMVQASVPQQGSVASLTSALTGLVGRTALPEPVARAAQQVLAGRLSMDGGKLDGAALQSAIRGSGIFQEALLARGQLALPQADMKSALLSLRQTLTAWLGAQTPVAAAVQSPPPIKGAPPRARQAEIPPPIDPAEPIEAIGKQVLERTESALARLRLHQHAALPDLSGKVADWSLDLPVIVGQHQTLMHIQIHRDEHEASQATAERGWQVRFAMNLPAIGEVGAQVSLRAGAMGIMLWASEAESAVALDAELDLLRADLLAAGLNPGAVIVRNAPPQPQPSPSGHFVDSRT